MEATRKENEIRVRRSEEARQAALFRKNQGSQWNLKGLLARFNRF
jgi:hypothetical protein